MDEREVVAVACGDIGDRGVLEIAVLSRRHLVMGRAERGRFIARKDVPLRDLSGIAASPLREPLGGIAIVPTRGALRGYVDLGITDRAHGNRLDEDLRPIAAIAGVPFATPYGDACTNFQGSTLNATVARCSSSDAAVDPSLFDGPLDTAASAPYVASDGTVRVVTATRDPRTGDLRVRADGKLLTLSHAGAQLAVSDLDQDGFPEIVSTLDVLPGLGVDQGDALIITTVLADGSLRERARMPVPNGVRAVGACPPDGPGAAPFLMATEGELWIVR